MSTAGCSRGLHPFRALPARSLAEVSPDLLSRASLSRSADQTQRRLRVSFGSRLVPTRACGDPTSWNGTTLLGFQHRVIPVIQAGRHPGLWIRLVSRHALLLTADTLWMVVSQTSLYRSCWDLLEVPSVRDLIKRREVLALVASFRVFGVVACSSASPLGSVLLPDWLLAQSACPAEVSTVLVS